MKILVFGGDSDIAKEIKKWNKNTILVSHRECDIRYPFQVEKVIIENEPDVIINCGGVSQISLIKDQNNMSWEYQINVNLVGSFNIVKAGVDNNIKTIILIGSVAGLYGKAEHSAYSASKAGVISLVQSLGMEGINAYCISPGRVDTKMREKDSPKEDKRTRISTQDVARTIFDCIKGKYKPGDNIIVRKIGFKKFIKVDRGQPWKKYLNVQPYGTPKTI